jgi:hypothetical protein
MCTQTSEKIAIPQLVNETSSLMTRLRARDFDGDLVEPTLHVAVHAAITKYYSLDYTILDLLRPVYMRSVVRLSAALDREYLRTATL